MELQDIDLKTLIERETGQHFNKQGYIKCPFHNEKTPSLSVKFFPDKNKEKFRCWGCDKQGDAIDFIMELKGIDYIKAREYLGLSVEKSPQEELREKVKGYIEWELTKFRKGQQLLGIFNFVNDKGEIAYFKAKFKNAEGKKELSYYHIENDKVINKRGCDELPYNLYKVIEGIKDKKVIIICEGEKDANTLNSQLKNSDYVATSIKGCKNISVLEGARIYVCSDTGEAGEQYKWHIYKELYKNSQEFKFINLPGIKSLGDNKDITDWLDVGHTKKDLINAFNRSLDLKSKFELQQDNRGIYKQVPKEKDDEITYKKKYLTDFRLLEATRVKFVDEDQEGVKLILKSSTGETISKQGAATVFDDVKSFKNFLGTLDLAFKGRVDDLTDLKTWINKFFALETEELFNGIQFKEKDNQVLFITNDGAVGKDKIYPNIKSDGRNNVDVMEIEKLTAAELKEIKKHLFRFASPEKTISIIGTIINNLAVAQCRAAKIKLHHLLIIGESGSGKSTILENVIAPILNYATNEIKSLGLATNFSLIKDLSDGNYSMIYEEHKPSRWDRYKISKISEVLRNLYDGSTVARGDKSLKSKNFYLGRPVIIAGEEGYYNNEKALMDRSCIIYTSKNERTSESGKEIKWLMENENLLNKLGKSLIEIILNLSVDKYIQIRNKVSESIQDLKDRPLNTAINICVGMEILNLLLKKYKIKTITGYTDHIVKNIKLEVLEGGEEAHSIVEQMITIYNDMIDDKRCEGMNVIVRRADGIFIKTSEMLNQIRVYMKNTGLNMHILENRDFKKQAMKAGYLTGTANKLIRVDGKIVRFDTYNMEKLRKLKVDAIAPPDAYDVTNEDNVIPFC
ncbi:CHC2 zinc finger domain-containing protein [Clostridium guangxiense]|uniref:CHC2 zinc finger domain-containing protein n=1 Tax=Clostridium guangxiense TaxID=1662055 RepID=UPI001E3A3C44|nr:CHC2 zinc finger domain-containing protein [Clostridium guangxiense]